MPLLALLVGLGHAGIPVRLKLSPAARDIVRQESEDATSVALDYVAPHTLFQIGGLVHSLPVLGQAGVRRRSAQAQLAAAAAAAAAELSQQQQQFANEEAELEFEFDRGVRVWADELAHFNKALSSIDDEERSSSSSSSSSSESSRGVSAEMSDPVKQVQEQPANPSSSILKSKTIFSYAKAWLRTLCVPS